MTALSRYLDPEILGQIAQHPFDPRFLVAGNLAGAHKSPQSGFAVEFRGHREYVPGDDPRHIDWRVYYRRDKYFVKQYELETNFVCHLLLDVSASMRFGEGVQQKLAYAARLASMLAYCVVKQNDKVSLGTFDTEVRGYLPPSNGLEQIVKMTHHLDRIDPVDTTDMTGCLMDLASRTHRREVVIILSDFFTDLAGLEEAVQRLRFQQHEVILFHVLDHAELQFPLQGMIKFIGLELPDQVLANAGELRRGYLKAFERFDERITDIVARNQCERVVFDTSRSMGDVLAGYLTQRDAVHRYGARGIR